MSKSHPKKIRFCSIMFVSVSLHCQIVRSCHACKQVFYFNPVFMYFSAGVNSCQGLSSEQLQLFRGPATTSYFLFLWLPSFLEAIDSCTKVVYVLSRRYALLTCYVTTKEQTMDDKVLYQLTPASYLYSNGNMGLRSVVVESWGFLVLRCRAVTSFCM